MDEVELEARIEAIGTKYQKLHNQLAQLAQTVDLRLVALETLAREPKTQKPPNATEQKGRIAEIPSDILQELERDFDREKIETTYIKMLSYYETKNLKMPYGFVLRNKLTEWLERAQQYDKKRALSNG